MSEERTEAADDALPAETAIGRVAIRVASIDELAPFYREAIGFRVERTGSTAALAAADGRELLVLREDPDAPPRPQAAAGLYHVAIRLPDRPTLADALERLRERGVRMSGASDHRVSEALYLDDPAGNGLELYRDRPREKWPRTDDGRVEMDSTPLDVRNLAAAGEGEALDRLPPGTDVGHVHLEATDLEASTAFYVDDLGFRRSRGPTERASFLSAGGYHHHLAVNVWNRRSAPAGDHQGLEWFEVVLPDGDAREDVVDRLADRGHRVASEEGVPVVTDPDGIEVRLAVGTSSADGDPPDR